MAERPAFVVCAEGPRFVRVETLTFTWFPGLARSQKQKSIAALHAVLVGEHRAEHPLEISTKSPDPMGVALSAFHLGFTCKQTGKWVSVESAFQGSKVFERGGPFQDLYYEDSRTAKAFFRDHEYGQLTAFSFYGQKWPIVPRTVFYDWLYMKCLTGNEKLSHDVQTFDAFTDIEFNPKRSINCQAYSAALYVALCRRSLANSILKDSESFIHGIGSQDFPGELPLTE